MEGSHSYMWKGAASRVLKVSKFEEKTLRPQLAVEGSCSGGATATTCGRKPQLHVEGSCRRFEGSRVLKGAGGSLGTPRKDSKATASTAAAVATATCGRKPQPQLHVEGSKVRRLEGFEGGRRQSRNPKKRDSTATGSSGRELLLWKEATATCGRKLQGGFEGSRVLKGGSRHSRNLKKRLYV